MFFTVYFYTTSAIIGRSFIISECSDSLVRNETKINLAAVHLSVDWLFHIASHSTTSLFTLCLCGNILNMSFKGEADYI